MAKKDCIYKKKAKKTLNLNKNLNRFNKSRFLYEKVGFEIIKKEDISFGYYLMIVFLMRKVLFNLSIRAM
jgi:glutaredoxin